MIGQVFWTAPFVEVLGKGQWVPGTAVAVASAIGLACAYALARSLLPRAWAAGCVLLTLAVPGILLNTSSFMTDVTAFSAEVACLLFGAAALHRSGRGRWALVAAAVVTGCFGFSIREFDLAAPVAVLIVLAVQDRRAWRAYGSPGLCTMVVCSAIYVWTAKLPGAHLESLSLPTGHIASPAHLVVFHLRLYHLAPSTLGTKGYHSAASGATGAGRAGAERAGVVAAAIFLGLGTLSLAKGWGLFIGNYLMQQGVPARPSCPARARTSSRERCGRHWRSSLCWRALRSRSSLLLRLVNREAAAQLFNGTTQSLVAWFALLSAGGLLAYGLLVKAPLFDRYLSQLAFPVAVLLAGSCLVSRATARPTHALGRTARAGGTGSGRQGWQGRDSGPRAPHRGGHCRSDLERRLLRRRPLAAQGI